MLAIPPEVSQRDISTSFANARHSLSVNLPLIIKIFSLWATFNMHDEYSLSELNNCLQALTEVRSSKPLFFEILFNITKSCLLLHTKSLAEAEVAVTFNILRSVTSLVDNNYLLEQDLVDYRNWAVHGSQPDPQWTITALKQLIALLKDTTLTVTGEIDMEELKNLQIAFVGKVVTSDIWTHSSKSEKLEALKSLSNKKLNAKLLETFEQFIEEVQTVSHQCLSVILLGLEQLLPLIELVSPKIAATLKLIDKNKYSCELDTEFTVERASDHFILFSLCHVFDAKSLQLRV